MPPIDDALDALQDSSYFSSVGLHAGYCQILMKEEDKAKTAFITSDGLF